MLEIDALVLRKNKIQIYKLKLSYLINITYFLNYNHFCNN